MSLYDYRLSNVILQDDPPFYALIMAAMRRADSRNAAILQAAYPGVCAEVEARYNAPGGKLESD